MQLDRQRLATRRRREAEAAARMIGAESVFFDALEGELFATLALRQRMIATIRRFRPDAVITHRTGDYHPDHRVTAQLVKDACDLLRVPNLVPEVPVRPSDPIVLGMCDFFRRPAPFQAHCVWLPHMAGQVVGPDRRAWLAEYYGQRPAATARRFGRAGLRYVEAFELSEYGRRVTPEALRALLDGVP
jgi:LmbE family N-acetylglucosaminyl deacetylase